MKLFTFDQFLTRGSAQVPSGKFVAAGIHCSSDVESCTIGGYKLGVKSIVPLSGESPRVDADRISLTLTAGLFSTDDASPADGVKSPGEKLVLQMYEPCDGFSPPGPRAPYFTRAALATLPATAAGAKKIARLPMSGRTRAALFWTGAAATCTINVLGIRANYGVAKGYFPSINALDFTTPAQTVKSGPNAGTNLFSRAVYIDNESFDELHVWAYDAGGGGLDFFAEVTGERL